MQRKQDHKYIILCILICLCCNLLRAQDSATEWIRTYGGRNNSEIGLSIISTQDSGYIMLNQSQDKDSNVHNAYGDYDLWVVKMKKNGLIEWENVYGCSQSDIPANILLTLDSCYLISGTVDKNDSDVTQSKGSSDIWLAKIDMKGKILWEKSYGGSDIEQLYKVINTPDSGYIFTGTTDSKDKDVTKSYGNSDIWVVKIDKNGKLLWRKNYGGSDYDEPSDIIYTPEDSGFLVCGRSGSNNGNLKNNLRGNDGWIFKIKKDGSLKWQKNLGTTDNDWLEGVTRLSYDTSYIFTGCKGFDILGQNIKSGDLWILKIKDSAIIWNKKFGGSNFERGNCIKSTRDSGVIIGGQTLSHDGDVNSKFNAKTQMGWIIKLNKGGIIEWQKTVGDTSKWSQTSLWSLSETLDNGFIFSGSANFYINVFVVKLKGQKIITNVKDEPIREQSILLYPNPASSLLTLQTTTPFTGTINIYNLTGQIIFSNNFIETQTLNINTESFGNGIYLLRLTDKNGVGATRKFVVSH